MSPGMRDVAQQMYESNARHVHGKAGREGRMLEYPPRTGEIKWSRKRAASVKSSTVQAPDQRGRRAIGKLSVSGSKRLRSVNKLCKGFKHEPSRCRKGWRWGKVS